MQRQIREWNKPECKFIIDKMLARLLDAHEMSHRDLANKVKMNHTTIYAWLKESKKPSVDKIMPVAHFFNVSIEYLCFGIGEDPRIINEAQENWEGENE